MLLNFNVSDLKTKLIDTNYIGDNMKTFKLHYTADVWMSVEIEANSKADAERLFNSGEHYEQGNHPVEEGMENVKIDMIDEIK